MKASTNQGKAVQRMVMACMQFTAIREIVRIRYLQLTAHFSDFLAVISWPGLENNAVRVTKSQKLEPLLTNLPNGTAI